MQEKERDLGEGEKKTKLRGRESAVSFLHFRYLSSPLQNHFFFPQPTKPVLEKRWFWTHSPLVRESWVPRSQPNFKHSHRWELQKHVRAKRNTLRTVAFSFPTETQNGLSKTMIPVSLTVGFSWNLDMVLEVQFGTLSPLGFVR